MTAALEEATALGKQAAGLHDDPAKWEAALMEALSAVKRAEGVLNSGEGDTGVRAAGGRPAGGAGGGGQGSAHDRRLEAARFQEAAGGQEGGFDKAGAIALYAAAFRQDDQDWDSLATGRGGRRINRRAIREDLLAALDDWSVITPNQDEVKRLRGDRAGGGPGPRLVPEPLARGCWSEGLGRPAPAGLQPRKQGSADGKTGVVWLAATRRWATRRKR